MLIGKNNGIINLSNPITGKNICSVDGITDASFTCNCETEYVYNSDNKKGGIRYDTTSFIPA